MKTINIDISDLYRGRGRTGIQRVVREVVSRLLIAEHEAFSVRVLTFDYRRKVFDIVQEAAALDLLRTDVDELPAIGSLAVSDFTADDVFYDLDSAWNSPLKRPELYRGLKAAGAMIVSTVYDLVPLRHPEFVQRDTLRNWVLYISAVYTWSDLVLLDSRSAECDFLEYAASAGVDRRIPTLVTRLGADFAVGGSLSEGEQAVVDRLAGRRYMLFVGTIEPRKRQALALEAMEEISRVDPEVHLVFAGRQGWNADDTVSAIQQHPLYGRRIHWIGDASDGLLHRLYEGCTLSLYLSHYEGFGLPVAESLQHGKVTIASRISSIFEVGRGFADYLHFGTPGELAGTVLAYLRDPRLRAAREQQIVSGYRPPTWDLVVGTIAGVFSRLDRAAALQSRPRPEKMQFVFISNVPESLQRTIELVDARVPWVDEYLVAGPEELRERTMAIPAAHPIVYVSDERLLGDRMAEFRAADHQRKNWILRSSLVRLPEVADEYIMLDDDNQPLAEVPLDTFLDDDRRYRGYYFYEMTEWPHRRTDYDQGQHLTARFLDIHGFEMLSYSSHQPQVIDKALFADVIALIDSDAPGESLDEWSVYFNALAAWYPTLLDKRAFLTMNWPDLPGTWDAKVHPERFLFENFYEGIYETGLFSTLPVLTPEAKAEAKAVEAEPFRQTRARYDQSVPVLRQLDMVHGALVFEHEGDYLVVEGVPHVVVSGTDPTLTLTLSFAKIGHRAVGTETQLCYRILGVQESYGMMVENALHDMSLESCGPIEMRFHHTTLAPGSYALEFFAKIGGHNVFPVNAKYRSRLVVAPAGDTLVSALDRL